MAAQQRPLSPHLQVYRPQITTVMSILHRATGVLLAIGAFALAAWLATIASGGDAYGAFAAWVGSTPGRLAMLAMGAALVYHWLNGIRHLLWDVGWGFEIPRVYASGYVVIALTVVITATLAWLGWNAGGVA